MWSFYHQARELDMLVSYYGSKEIPSPPVHVPSPLLPLPSPPTSPTYDQAPLGYKAAMIQSRVALPPLLLPPTTHRDDILEASSTVIAARQVGQALTSSVDYGFIDTVDSSIRAFKSRTMTVVVEDSERVLDLAITHRQEAHELQVHYEDVQDGQDFLIAQVSLLTRERRSFARWLLLTSVRLLRPIGHGLSLRAGARPWRPSFEHCRGMFKELVPMRDARPQEGPADAGSSC
ncbi:hypothetical protein Tco_0954307 [Tanacetum coccineum]|uniref:Uncharacterized protein n=1 Tax=Tanacetum coccineum TaxID=301880 RepID=A0ABQ5E308_9ASTR